MTVGLAKEARECFIKWGKYTHNSEGLDEYNLDLMTSEISKPLDESAPWLWHALL